MSVTSNAATQPAQRVAEVSVLSGIILLRPSDYGLEHRSSTYLCSTMVSSTNVELYSLADIIEHFLTFRALFWDLRVWPDLIDSQSHFGFHRTPFHMAQLDTCAQPALGEGAGKQPSKQIARLKKICYISISYIYIYHIVVADTCGSQAAS